MMLSDYSQAEIIILCPLTIIYNHWGKNNLLGDILNAVDNVDDQEDYGFRGSYVKTDPTVIDDYTKKKFLNMEVEILRPKINIENNDKDSDEIYQNILIDKKI